MDPVVHFEMPAEDRQRMADFYTKTFGWKTQILGPDMGNYVMATTVDSPDKRPKDHGAINGGFYQQSEDMPTHPSIVIAVENIEESMKKITESGGKVLGEPMDIPGVGKYVSFTDTEGNRCSILQPSPM